MLLREFFIKVTTKYDPKGFNQADKGASKLSKSSKSSGRDVAKLGRGLDKTGKEARTAGRQVGQAGDKASQAGSKAGKAGGRWARLSKGLGRAGAAAKRVAKQLAVAGAAAALAAVAGSIALVGKKTAELDQIAKGAQKTGLGTDAYQRLSHVAELSGTGIDALAKSSINLNKNLHLVSAGGGKEVTQALADIGLSADQLDGKSAEEQLDLIARSMQGIESAEEKTRLAMVLFGKQGSELLPLLNSSSAELDNMAKSAGKIFTREELAKAEQYRDALSNLKKAASDVVSGAVLELAPMFQNIAERATEWVESNRELLASVLPRLIKLGKTLFSAIEPLVDLIGWVIEKFGDLEGSGAKLATGLQTLALAVAAVKLAFMGPAGLVAAAALAGVAIGNLLNSFGASDALANFLGDITGLNKQLAKLDAMHGGRTGTRGAPELAGGPIKKHGPTIEFQAGGKKFAGDMAALTEVASGKGAGKDPAMRRAASQALEAKLADGSEQNRKASLARAQRTIAQQRAAEEERKSKKGKGKGKGKGDDFFDFTSQVKAAAKSQAEEFAAKELQRLMSTGMEAEEAQGAAKTAGRARAKELEAQFIKAGRVIEAGQKGILDVLGLRDPGSMLDNRPPPQSLTIYIAPTIKMVETMTITVNGGDSPDQRQSLQDAANQAEDAIYAKLSDVPAIVEDMFRLHATRLRNRGTGGSSAAGGT